MHSQSLIHITICIELFLFLCGLNFLAKIKRDSLGRIYQILTCLILTIVTLVLVCTLWSGFSRMCCHKGKGECKEMEMEKCMDGDMKHCKMMMMHKSDCEEMSGCDMMKKGESEEMEGACPYDKNGKCIGDEKKCKEMKSEGCKDMKMEGCSGMKGGASSKSSADSVKKSK
ncbi:MAG: hypothetical protein WCL14_02615 [Bacteroidota bacterium]